MTGGIALSTDEVRAAAWLSGCVPPGMFGTDWVDDEVDVAHAVATRGMLARGLAERHDDGTGPEVMLSPGVHSTLAPLLRPEYTIELVVAPAAAARRRHLVAESAAGVVLAEEHGPAVWWLAPRPEPAERVMISAVLPLIDRGGTGQHAGPEVCVPDDVLTDAAKLLAQDGAAMLAAMLRAGGLSVDHAKLLAGVLTAVDTTVTVRSWRKLGPASHASATLTWHLTGSMGTWLAVPAPAGSATVFVPTSEADLRTALLEVLAAEEQP